MIARYMGARRARVIVVYAGALALAFAGGCGGGGGGSQITMAGTALKPAVRSGRSAGRDITGTALVGATIKAYLWPKVTDPDSIASTQTTDGGTYSLSLPAADAGKDVVLICTSGVTRLARIVPAVPSRTMVGVDLNSATTLAAEAIASAAAAKGISALDSAAVSAIEAEFAKWDEASSTSCDVGSSGCPLPATFGGGLADGDAKLFTSTNAVVKAALGNLGASANSDVATAKRMVQWMRDTVQGVMSPSLDQRTTLAQAISDQRDALKQQTDVVWQFHERVAWPLGLLNITTHESEETIVGLVPGQYDQVYDSNTGFVNLTKTADAADGKSWIVTSRVADDTLGMVLTVTPANKVASFRLGDPAVGTLTLRVTKAGDSSVDYHGTATLTANGTDHLLQSVAMDLVVNDNALKGPITFSGSAAGQPAGGTGSVSQGVTPLKSITFRGTYSTPGWTATVGSAVMTWATSSAVDAYPSQASIGNVSARTTLASGQPSSTFSLDNATLDIEQPDPANHFPHGTPKHLRAGTATLNANNNVLTLSGVDLAITRSAVQLDGVWKAKSLPSGLSASASYTGANLRYSGTISCSWTNPVASFQLGTSSSTDFPQATINTQGTVTPQVGVPVTATLNLTSSNAVNSGKVSATLTADLAYASESLHAVVTATYRVASGIVQAGTTLDMTATHSPSGTKIVAHSEPGVATSGSITNSSGVKIADIGRAQDLNMPDLGSLVIVKYTDGTFETAASLLR